MAFLFHTIDGRKTAGIEYLPAGAMTPKVGLALVMEDGSLAVASGAVKPTYVCLREEESAVTTGTVIPVARVLPDTIFETTASVDMTSVSAGNKVTLSADGLQITATTENGVAEIVEMDDTAAGSAVRVRFA